MLNQRYCSEIESLLIQFQSAINDGKIYRKNEEGSTVRIDVPRCVLSGKGPTFYDIVNKAGNITFPVIVIEPNSIDLRKDKLNNKIIGQSVPQHGNRFSYRQPTPISIKVTLHVYTRLWDDLWQIFSNFAVYCQDYFFVSWRTPTELTTDEYCEEIRCKVTYGGSFNIDYPKTLEETKLFIVHGTANFTIDGFLFEKPVGANGNIIYSIHNNLGIEAYSTMIQDENGEYDYYQKDGWPSVTTVKYKDIFLDGSESPLYIEKDSKLNIEGRSFFNTQATNVLIIPEDDTIESIPGFTKVEINTVKKGIVRGFSKDGLCNVTSENNLTVTIPELPKGLEYTLAVYNNVGFVTLKGYNNLIFKA